LSQAGTFTINLRVAGNFLGGNRYRSMFSDAAGNTPPVAVGALQADASLHLLDELILTGGYTYSTSSLIPSAGFGGFSLSRPPNKGRK
jgi:hypothetical protein